MLEKILALAAAAQALHTNWEAAPALERYQLGEALVIAIMIGGQSAYDIKECFTGYEFKREVPGSDIAFFIMRAAVNMSKT